MKLVQRAGTWVEHHRQRVAAAADKQAELRPEQLRAQQAQPLASDASAIARLALEANQQLPAEASAGARAAEGSSRVSLPGRQRSHVNHRIPDAALKSNRRSLLGHAHMLLLHSMRYAALLPAGTFPAPPKSHQPLPVQIPCRQRQQL